MTAPYTTVLDGEWHYLPHGKRTHFRRRYTDGLGTVGTCGVGTRDPSDWRGTGNQAEHERAVRMAKCRRCLARVQLTYQDNHLRPFETVRPKGGLL